MKLKFIFFLLLFTHSIIAQERTLWNESEDNSQIERQIIPSKYLVYELDFENLKNQLRTMNQTMELSIPTPDGRFEHYIVKDAPIMHPDLSTKFPNIRTFKAINKKNPSHWGRIDFTHKGFHAMIYSSSGTIFIDPYGKDNTTQYIVYYKKDFHSNKQEKHQCGFDPQLHSDEDEMTVLSDEILSQSRQSQTFYLRNYRIAIAATGEYTLFHGGTKEDGLAAIVTTMNRVNQVYERDFSIHFNIIANNEDIIYTDGTTDPYNNGNANAMINENQINLDATIGTANYDIGHVFGTNSGGLAWLQSVCSFSNKARGITGSANPVNDPFDIDYVAHEIGHQFGGNHTFNNCGGNESFTAAMEPGSGSTIMAYAGLCGSNNVQTFSDPYFHVKSLEEMYTFASVGNGSTCADVDSTVFNTSPSITMPASDFYIPISTPFELNAMATDIEDTGLQYCWEQYNLGPNSNLGSPSGDAPSFRSFEPVDTSVRFFPEFVNVISNINSIKEVLPTYSRNLDFKCTVRDNNASGGSFSTEVVSFNATDEAGPFQIIYPNLPNVEWGAGNPKTVNWQVANTDIAPVNCSIVDIYLSYDGGYTYPVQLADDVANDGEHEVIIPQEPLTNTGRIMIKAADNIFYDINNTNFKIVEATGIHQIEDATINIYPNPAHDNLYIDTQNIDITNLKVRIYNMNGQMMFSDRLEGNEEISLSHLPPAIYTVEVFNDDINIIDKIVKL